MLMLGRGCLIVSLFLGFFFVIAPGNVEAQSVEGDEILRKNFNVKSWKERYSSGGRIHGVNVFYGHQYFSYSGGFEYGGKKYTVNSFETSSRSNVSVNISPKFPPDGAKRSNFTLHLGSSGRDLDSFNFGDANVSGNTSKWSGTSESLKKGYIENDDRTENGIIRITGLPPDIGKNLQFAEIRPKPTETSGRIEVVSDLNNDENTKRWRICNRGFGKEEAKVACRQLGLNTSGARPFDLNTTNWLKITRSGWNGWIDLFEIWGIAATPALLDNLECVGDEDALVDCKHSGIGIVSNACSINNTAAVICGDASSSGNNNSVQCPCGKAPNGKCWAPSHCGQGGGFGE